MKTKAWSPAITFVLLGITATTLASAALDWQRLPLHPDNMSLLATSESGLPVRNLRLGDWSVLSTPPGLLPGLLPKPGVYKTVPYACIVVVPDKCPDDRSVVALPERGSTMPVIKPELRFLPLRSK
jgi:hypothetical protein